MQEDDGEEIPPDEDVAAEEASPEREPQPAAALCGSPVSNNCRLFGAAGPCRQHPLTDNKGLANDPDLWAATGDTCRCIHDDRADLPATTGEQLREGAARSDQA